MTDSTTALLIVALVLGVLAGLVWLLAFLAAYGFFIGKNTAIRRFFLQEEKDHGAEKSTRVEGPRRED